MKEGSIRIYPLKLKLGLFIFLIFSYLYTYSQDKKEDRLLQLMHEGVSMMDTGNYAHADQRFKEVLKNLEVLPSEICYYFGKNSYFLMQYKQSINWLNKYIELKGTTGRYFQDCVDYLARAEQAYKLEEEINRQNAREELSRQNKFDCKGNDYFKCPLCLGDGVLIRPGKLNTIYQTCPFCNGEGRITCDNYQKYLRGELQAND
jgi:hypothetical protein